MSFLNKAGAKVECYAALVLHSGRPEQSIFDKTIDQC